MRRADRASRRKKMPENDRGTDFSRFQATFQLPQRKTPRTRSALRRSRGAKPVSNKQDQE
jgi:hypothetical protein